MSPGDPPWDGHNFLGVGLLSKPTPTCAIGPGPMPNTSSLSASSPSFADVFGKVSRPARVSFVILELGGV